MTDNTVSKQVYVFKDSLGMYFTTKLGPYTSLVRSANADEFSSVSQALTVLQQYMVDRGVRKQYRGISSNAFQLVLRTKAEHIKTVVESTTISERVLA